MITAFIVDDKPANIHTLQQMIQLYCPGVEITGTAENIDMAYAGILQHHPSLVFLDVEMPGGSGFELLRKFTSIKFEVIFVTAYDQHAVKAFRENALDYLLKPVDIDALQGAIAKAEKQLELKQVNKKLEQYFRQSATGKVSIPVLDGYLFIVPNEIVRCEAAGSYTFFHMTDGRKLTVSMRLKECEDLLPANSFFRVHHSHLVNLVYIVRYVRGRGGYLHMQDGSTVDVAASRRDAFLDIMKR